MPSRSLHRSIGRAHRFLIQQPARACLEGERRNGVLLADSLLAQSQTPPLNTAISWPCCPFCDRAVATSPSQGSCTSRTPLYRNSDADRAWV